MLRSLAADKPVGPELDDGLTSMAVTAWVLALVPPPRVELPVRGRGGRLLEGVPAR